ncbi:MAG: multicopper oxidase domain-containing protein [Proteobacteria bacterium]|nr:multicopper oxidase domain-containing protein [Pseudomonadota bacterium]
MVVVTLLAGLLGACDKATYEPYKEPPPSIKVEQGEVQAFCPETIDPTWREAQTIAGVEIQESRLCLPDNPSDIAAFVRGTNNLTMTQLMGTQLSTDALVKGRDLDGDGDPDEIHIRLEVVELNGGSPDSSDPMTTFEIAPGVKPGFWAFAPKTRGMATENFESNVANSMLRLPSPTIRVEQGDKVTITLENSHYFPHTIHLHGVDHPYVKENGEGNDGVPQTSGPMIMPGQRFSYELQPRHAGTMAYHCHVQTGAHLLMGLIGLFVIEENRPNNPVQTFNIGAGHVRHPSVAVRESYDREYDLLYIDTDTELHNIIRSSNDVRKIAKSMNREYKLSESTPDYFLLNGRSFPYTLRESIIVTAPDENVKLRILNAGTSMLALHTHGHKPTITHYDGVELAEAAQVTRDVIMVGSAQRVDLKLSTHNDGLHSYGEGIWLYHDHTELGITSNNMMPGGNIATIVYESYLSPEGMPKTQGVSLMPYFSPEYYQRKVPVWSASDPDGQLGEPQGE